MSDKVVWTARPSQYLNIFVYILFFWTIIGPLMAYLAIRFTIYEVTEQRFIQKTGVLNQKIDELELYRVRDYRIEKPLYLRIFGLGNLILVTSDKSDPRVAILAIKDVENLRDKIRNSVEIARKKTGTKEVDFT